MKNQELKKKIVGKKLLTIITLEATTKMKNILGVITEETYNEIDDIKLLVFEDGVQLLYTDYDCDGYRSGSWYLHILNEVLDKGATKEVKNINSIVRDIVYMEVDDKYYFMITTDEYIIMMGQDSSDSYYPSNFFNVEETKEKAIEEAGKTKYDAEEIEHE
jgi:hypothetical protein